MGMKIKINCIFLLFLFFIGDVRSQIKEFHWTMNVVDQSGNKKNDLISKRLVKIESLDESKVLYYYVLSYKNLVVDSNFLESYKFARKSLECYRNQSFAKQLELDQNVFDFYLKPDSLCHLIENLVYEMVKKDGSKNMYSWYLTNFQSRQNKNIENCQFTIDSLLYSELGRGTIYGNCNYLRISSFHYNKKEATERLSRLESELAKYVLSQESSSAVKSYLSSFCEGSVWTDTIKIHYLGRRWFELKSKVEIDILLDFQKELNQFSNSISQKGSLKYLENDCIDLIESHRWAMVSKSTDIKDFFNFLSITVGNKYVDSALGRCVAIIEDWGDFNLAIDLAPYIGRTETEYLLTKFDDFLWRSYMETKAISDLKRCIELSKTQNYLIKATSLNTSIIRDSFIRNPTVDEYYRLINYTIKDEATRQVLNNIFNSLYPYSHSLLSIEGYEMIRTERFTGIGWSPKYHSNDIFDIGFNYTRDGNIYPTGFVLKHDNKNNLYVNLFLRKKLSDYFYIFDVGAGQELQNPIIIFFDKFSVEPFKFVGVLPNVAMEVELFSAPDYYSKTKQAVIKVKENSHEYGVPDVFGLKTIDFNETILPTEFTDISLVNLLYNNTYQDMLRLSKSELVGLADINGNIILNAVFKDLILEYHGFNSSNLQIVEYNGRFGLMNVNFEMKIDAIYDEIKYLNFKSYFSIRSGRKGFGQESFCRIFNANNSVFLPTKYYDIENIGNNYFLVSDVGKVNDKYIINSNFQVSYKNPNYRILDCRFGDNNCLTVRGWRKDVDKVRRWSLLFLDEKKLVSLHQLPLFSSLGVLSNNRVIYELNNKYGFLDKNGKVVIAPIYDNANDFVNGYALVSLYGNYFKIDQNGNKVE
jgi:hypothetical protein